MPRPEVADRLDRAIDHLTGAGDSLAHVAVRDSEHLREFVLTGFSIRPEVAHLETSLIFSHRRNRAFGLRPGRAPVAPGM